MFHSYEYGQDDSDASSLLVGESSSVNVYENCLLTCGRAWAISLTFRDTVNEELSRACFPRKSTGIFDDLLYRFVSIILLPTNSTNLLPSTLGSV